MILVDTNLLVYAFISAYSQHDAAREWLDSRLNAPAAVGLPWASLLGFLRLVTNRRVFAQPATLASAWRQVEEWLDCAPVWVPSPGERHRSILGDLFERYGAQGDLVPDVHLAALAIEHGLVLYSADGDFARFAELKWENPLTS